MTSFFGSTACSSGKFNSILFCVRLGHRLQHTELYHSNIIGRADRFDKLILLEKKSVLYRNILWYTKYYALLGKGPGEMETGQQQDVDIPPQCHPRVVGVTQWPWCCVLWRSLPCTHVRCWVMRLVNKLYKTYPKSLQVNVREQTQVLLS